ncbi:DNA utilization family protein [Yersinia similis]|nr:DNA utilization family protein [Yersinia similis]AHK19022.1 membrane protein [Yersinia similis]
MSSVAIGLFVIGLLQSSVFASPHLANIERDPFQAVLAISCDSKRERLAGWKLQGIVSGDGYQAAWIQRPDATWQRLTLGTRLISEWQVTQISAQWVDLQYENPEALCSELSVVLSLFQH